MPQAILTRYLSATNYKPSRIKASCDRGSLTIGYPHEFSGEECHREAARQLVAKFIAEDVRKYGTDAGRAGLWSKPFVTGGLPTGDVAHVFVA